MRRLLVLTLLLGSITLGCGDTEVASTSQTDPSQNANNTTTANSPQTTQSSSPSQVKASGQNTQPVTAVANSPAAQNNCQLSAYVIDKDPQGLNVRSGPGSNHQVIDNLPTTTAGVMVDITASQGDWVQITLAESPQKVEFQGKGWVYASMLGTSTRGYGTEGVSVYNSANGNSKVIGRIPSSTGVKLLGCNGVWAFVEYEGLKGWVAPDDQCSSALTTCS